MKSLKQFKQTHKLFFKNGNVNNRTESYRVWKNHLIVFEWIDGENYSARVYRENSAGALLPCSDKVYFSHTKNTFKYAVLRMRGVVNTIKHI